MEWVRGFYEKQYSMWELNDTEELEYQQKLLNTLKKYAPSLSGKVLELGGGRGYFAVAAAKLGYEVTVIELAKNAVQYTYQLAKQEGVLSKITVIHEDFYKVELTEQYDVVCYWDGFGIGVDQEQQVLLKRIHHWLCPDGTALIDIYTPWYWAKVSGMTMQIKAGVFREYDFDALNCRMIDSWWEESRQQEKITQSLRCYSPADLELLISDIPLTLTKCGPGGEMNYEQGVYTESVSLGRAMSYLAVLRKE
ncbi:SAM-dependent methyltransferase [Oceanobacillus sp. 1P07AA]|uniref:SAM-dependent methyltransferase n=1 Tax=Oceanobacillus sp. 1P07AA TaxID=3132293 RepID=UPI0039A439A1